MPYWDYAESGDVYEPICGPDLEDVHHPWISLGPNGTSWDIHSCFNLQLARGIYQVSKVRGSWEGGFTGQWDECPYAFREPWFQGRGRDPVFKVALPYPGDDVPTRLSETYFPNWHCIYTFEQLELDGGRLLLDMERSATWPRRATEYYGSSCGNDGAASGAVMAKEARDEYENRVAFKRVPTYGWETDYKTPFRGDAFINHCDGAEQNCDAQFGAIPMEYRPSPNAWRLPHKRLQTVTLKAASSDDPSWTIAFVYEHPESDRISATDTADSSQWKSLYSDLEQAAWKSGRLPELHDQTTLLTVQAYRQDHLNGTTINGAPFQDDQFVWADDFVGTPHQVNLGPEYDGDYNGDGCPGICGVDDDGDGLVDEDPNGLLPGDEGYGLTQTSPAYYHDDNEDGVRERECNPVRRVVNSAKSMGSLSSFTSAQIRRVSRTPIRKVMQQMPPRNPEIRCVLVSAT